MLVPTPICTVDRLTTSNVRIEATILCRNRAGNGMVIRLHGRVLQRQQQAYLVGRDGNGRRHSFGAGTRILFAVEAMNASEVAQSA